MAGQIPLTTKYYPSDFNVTTLIIPQHAIGSFATTPAVSFNTSPANRSFPVAYFDRDAVIDSISVWFESLTSATDLTFYKLAAPTTASGGSPSSVTGQQAITSTKTLSAASPQQVATGVTSGFTINTSHNIVPAGSMLWLGYTTIVWATSVGQVQVQVRWRSQL